MDYQPSPLNTSSAMPDMHGVSAESEFRLPQRLDIFNYFQGKTLAYGIFEDRFGKLRRSFKVYIQGDIDGQKLRLTEDFQYDDGEKSQRVWLITDQGDCVYSGEAEDILGAASGLQESHYLYWRYSMNLEIQGRAWKVQFDDRMYLLNEKVMVNRARVSKWGLTLGTVSIFFSKQ
ncbi:DUF3833 domain-containing protein [Aliamphritea ceti]|uniref:DUF3833 domain-containing protein n=1 Tax=Aliamphritea ceti TaxID=1524258 RepID=UPI0021C27255|nr:DUF3833 domain-containing protein [Aliamphritea ceti]